MSQAISCKKGTDCKSESDWEALVKDLRTFFKMFC